MNCMEWVYLTELFVENEYVWNMVETGFRSKVVGDLKTHMAERGKKGWELINIFPFNGFHQIGHELCWKRPIENKESA